VTDRQTIAATLEGRASALPPQGGSVVVTTETSRQNRRRSTTAAVTDGRWTAPVELEVVPAPDETRYDITMEPAIAAGPSAPAPPGAGLARLTIAARAVRLSMNPPLLDGARATVNGTADGLAGRPVTIVVETRQRDDAAWTERATREQMTRDWTMPDVALRDPNGSGGPIDVRAVVAPQQPGVHVVGTIATARHRVTVPEPRARITHINGADVAVRTPSIAPGSICLISGTAANLVEGDSLWVKILGSGERDGQEDLWAPADARRTVKVESDSSWETRIAILTGTTFTTPWQQFTVRAGIGHPPISAERFWTAPGHMIRCPSAQARLE
jgi:hypothetical protein